MDGAQALVKARSEYIVDLQHMLRSACRQPQPGSEAGAAVLGGAEVLLPPRPVRAPPSFFPQPAPRPAPPQPLPADAGAGSYASCYAAFPTPAPEDCATSLGAAAVVTSAEEATHAGGYPDGGDAACGSSPTQVAAARIADYCTAPGGGGPPQAGITAARYEEVANEVLRLRLLWSQHEELRTQLSRAEKDLRRLSPHSVFQLRSFYERHFKDPAMAASVQEALLRLLESLCAMCRVPVGACNAASLLNCTRRLFRDPHNFTGRLCALAPASSEEAKCLAPFLLPSTQYRRVREKEVNDCYDAFHAWISSFYLFSVASDQGILQALDENERLLRRLGGQGGGAEPSPASGTSSATAPASRGAGRSSAAARAANSPIGRGGAAAPRASPTRARPQASTEEVLAALSRSPSPGARAGLGGVPRPRVVSTSSRFAAPSRAAAAAASARAVPAAPAPAAAAALHALAQRHQSPTRASVGRGGAGDVASSLGARSSGASPVLSRAPSEKALGGTGIVHSPRGKLRDSASRMSSPVTARSAAGRLSPTARAREHHPGGVYVAVTQAGSSAQAARSTRRSLSPSQSSTSVKRMVSAPSVGLCRARPGDSVTASGRRTLGRQEAAIVRVATAKSAVAREDTELDPMVEADAFLLGPGRRELPAEQLEALVRYAQQVVTSGATPPT